MEPLGQGGMATVWLARDLKHDRLVAIKLLRPELAVPVGAERFAREIGIVAKLNHPNILGVIDSGVVQADGITAPYYVMPHVEGPSLSALLARGEKLPVNESLRLAGEVADALAFAHSRGIVHRDIKPGNILIQAGHALVADFGVAIALDAATTGGRHATHAGEILGTPVYMSPEQASGSTQLDGRSDVYSLGCVLYEMLAGDPPFTGNTPQAMIVAHLTTPPPPLATRQPGISPALAATVHRALEKLPSSRYATAGEFRDAIDRMRTAVAAPRRWWPTVALVAGVALLFWWSPWRRRSLQSLPGGDIVVLLSGFRDRTGTMRPEGAALDDALRKELQGVPGLRVVDVADAPEVALDSVRKRYRPDWVIRGALDRVGDSVSATVRVLEARNGSEVRSATAREASAAALQPAAMAISKESVFGAVRLAMDSVLLDHWAMGMERDSTTLELRRRAREAESRSLDALLTVGPRRMLEELALADSLLATAQAQRPASVLPIYERALLSQKMGFAILAARQFFPDSAWIPEAEGALRRGLTFANAAVKRAPQSAETWFVRSQIFFWLAINTPEPAWRDSALSDARQATAIAGSRPDIWALRGRLEAEAGRWKESLFSVEQGEASDRLHVNADHLLYQRAIGELALGRMHDATESCRRGSRLFPGNGYFITCEAQVAARASRQPTDARMILVLADSIAADSTGPYAPFIPDDLRMFAVAILARAGLTDSAGALYHKVIGGLHGAIVPAFLVDAAYARQELGDLDSALTMLALAVQLEPTVVPTIERDPWYESLRRHPRFPAAMKGITPREALGTSGTN